MATSNKRKKAVAATVAAAAILLAGTFAWTSISQQALNESAGIVNVGGRLHDDFDGENKDVYVENFTDPLNGGQPIYARIRLDEYMEVGQDAGGVDDGDGIDEVVTILAGTERNQESTWQTHVPSENCAECAAEGSGCVIHDCWEWTMGGDKDGTPDGQTTFMPTFNKDKDSLKSDRNGTYQGTNPDDKVYYDDYVIYSEDGKANVAFTEKEGIDGSIASVVGTAYYDNDTNTDEEDHVAPAGTSDAYHKAVTETHTAKKTATADVVLMKDWDGNPGNFWVYDTDGWAYWANPIMPGEATGLLLDGIRMKQNPGEKCYYGINVVAQFATIGDWEFFENKDGSLGLAEDSDALKVMTAASSNVAKVTVTNLDGQTTVDVASDDLTVAFEAKETVGMTAAAAEGDFTWEVYDADLNQVRSTINANGVLSVNKNEKTEALIIVARSKNHAGAVGLSSIALTGIDYKTPVIASADAYLGSSNQDLILSDLEDSDYPLIVTVHEEFDRREPALVMTIYGVNKDDGTVNYVPQEGHEGDVGRLSVIDGGNIWFSCSAYWFLRQEGDGNTLDCRYRVTDAFGNYSETENFTAYGKGCFAAGTKVVTADGFSNIEDIKVGDMVYSVNLESGEKELAPVTWVMEDYFVDETYTISIEDETIVTTAEHPFYVENKGWVKVKDLEAGDKVNSMVGSASVIEKIQCQKLDEPIQVYNFTVDGNHNYLITEAELLVHNKV